jgi:hypothetical protein
MLSHLQAVKLSPLQAEREFQQVRSKSPRQEQMRARMPPPWSLTRALWQELRQKYSPVLQSCQRDSMPKRSLAWYL